MLRVILSLFLFLSPVFAQDLIIEVEIKGGFAGFHERIKIFDNRDVIVSSKGFGFRRGTIDQETLNELMKTINDLQHLPLKNEYTPERPMYEGFIYVLYFSGHKVIAQDPVNEVPKELLRVIDLIKTIRRQVL